MVPSGPPTPVGSGQNIPPSLLRSNSGILGTQVGSVPSQQPAFPSLISPRSQYSNMNLLGIGNMSNVSSLLNQAFANGGSNSGLSGSGCLQRGGIDMGAESDPLSGVGNSMGFTPSASFVSSSMGNPGSSAQTPGQQFPSSSGNQMVSDQHQQPAQLEAHNFQRGQQSLQQLSVPNSQQQYQSFCGGLNHVVSVKMEPQMSNEQNVQQQQQQQQQMQSFSSVKMEPQQLQPLRNLVPVKTEPQHSDQSLFMQQQQQQLLQISRQNSQAAAAQMNYLQQQRILQAQQQQQQQQQQQILKALPQQRAPLPHHFQQSLPARPAIKPAYEPGTCARRLTHYMYNQQRRPPDNNIDFWKKFVAEYFAPHGRKRWCVSQYGSGTGRQTTGVFPQDVWQCEICNRKPGRGFETTVEVLPRLCKIKYDSGTLEELLYVDMPREYQNTSGQIVLDYAKAVQESVFEQLRVVREGQLRIVFSSDLKICSWEFCARHHEELIPRRLIIPQVSQLGGVAQKYQNATQNASSNLSTQELQANCNMFVASARQLAKALEVPLVNDLGYTKRYVRCLQISEVVNSMKDLIDYSRETGTGPMASLINFPRRTAATSSVQQHGQGKPPENHPVTQNSSDHNTIQQAVQPAPSNGGVSASNSLNGPSTSTSASTIAGLLHQNSMNSRQENPAGLLHQNSMNSRQENPMSNANSPYAGNTVQIPSASSSTSLPPQQQPNPSSPFPSPTLSAANSNPPQTSHNPLSTPVAVHLNSVNSPANIPVQQPSQSSDADLNDSHSSVQQIIHEMMMTSQLNGGGNIAGVNSLGNDVKNIHGIMQTGNAVLNAGNCLIGNGVANSSGINGVGYGNMNGLGPSVTANGIRAVMANNSTLSGRVSMPSLTQDPTMNHQQQDLGSRLLSELGAVNGFNNLQFDWKPSP